MMKIPAIIVDLDGTLANVSLRRKELMENKNWNVFHSKIKEDTINIWCKEIIEKFKSEYKIVLVTGRKESYKPDTLEWLSRHQVHFDDLFFREIDDFRQDDVVKKELFNKHIYGKYEVFFVVDDRSSVVKMWRSLGMVCLQCDEGDF